jgi:hypothetical protein
MTDSTNPGAGVPPLLSPIESAGGVGQPASDPRALAPVRILTDQEIEAERAEARKDPRQASLLP